MNQGEQNTKIGFLPVSIEKELKSSFLDYAMSVIVSRALPSVRDGLKPVHRRILFAMHRLGLYNEKPYRKSAAVIGEVLANYHPHGDGPIYQTMVGLAQDFSKRYPLLDGQGNWGSIDGDSAAAFRYTEVRMKKICAAMLSDIEKETVNFVPNFDESCTEPTVLPSRIPQLLINGANGIAVGMATSIPPHNLSEIIEACIAVIKDPNLSIDELLRIVPGPDFPCGGIICGRQDVIKAYKTGHGSVTIRGVVDVEESDKRTTLIVREIPYQVNKSDLITKIADLVKNKIIDGISNIKDESSREGTRIVLELKRGETASVILNQLYKHTSLQDSFPIIMLALKAGQPVIFTLREVIDQFILHRKEVVTRRSEFELAKNKERLHILMGFITALENIDKVIAMIKASQNDESAILILKSELGLSEGQAKSILEMRLKRLTAMEIDKIRQEIVQVGDKIRSLEEILGAESVLDRVIIDELMEIKNNFADPRRTTIEQGILSVDEIDLIPNEEMVVTLTDKGYLKRVKTTEFSVQHRGGKGKKGTADLEEFGDIIKDVFIAKNHDTLLFFTNLGRVYSKYVFEVPEGSRTARGRAIANVLPLSENETVVKLLCITKGQPGFLVMVTQKGTIKKTSIDDFQKIRSTGIIAIDLNEGDQLAFCALSNGEADVIICTSNGQGIRFKETEVRAMGRTASGVRAIAIRGKGTVVGMIVIDEKTELCDLLFATEGGYGKRVKIADFRVAHRAGMGVRTIPTTGRNGSVVSMVKIKEDYDVLLIDKSGKIMRLSSEEVRTMGRQAQGVRLIKLDEGQKLSTVVSLENQAEEIDSKEESAEG